MNKKNYDKEMKNIIDTFGEAKPKLLLHSCCAPCSSAVLERLYKFFDITIYYYNPNISPKEEYQKRVQEQQRFCEEYSKNLGDVSIPVISAEYNPQSFYSAVKGYEDCPEGGERCFICYKIRLEQTAKYAKENGFDYFCSTLTVSPLKNCERLNEIGQELSSNYSVSFLPSDFKKQEGYKRSIQLSKEFSLYRQNFCGCTFSRNSINTNSQ